MSSQCPCDAELKTPAELAHGVCDGCRVTAHRRVSRRTSEPAETVPLFDAEPEPRRLVELPDWPDYRAQGVT